MANPVISGNDVFSHVFTGAANVAQSAFYDAALGALGIKNLGPFGSGWVLYGRDKPAFIIARPGNGEAPSSNGATIGCGRPVARRSMRSMPRDHRRCRRRQARPARPPARCAYAAYLRDPAGNKVTAYAFV